MFEELNARRDAVAQNIVKSFDSALEKARVGRYVDNSENRRLFRVGQSYKNANGGNRRGDVVEAITLTGQKVKGTYVGTTTIDSTDMHKIKANANTFYNVRSISRNITKEQRDEVAQKEKRFKRIAALKTKLSAIESERRYIEREQENDPDVLADYTNGQNPAVVMYGKKLDSLDKLETKVRQELEKLK